MLPIISQSYFDFFCVFLFEKNIENYEEEEEEEQDSDVISGFEEVKDIEAEKQENNSDIISIPNENEKKEEAEELISPPIEDLTIEKAALENLDDIPMVSLTFF